MQHAVHASTVWRRHAQHERCGLPMRAQHEWCDSLAHAQHEPCGSPWHARHELCGSAREALAILQRGNTSGVPTSPITPPILNFIGFTPGGLMISHPESLTFFM